MDLATITERMAVRNAVQSGNVEDAIDRVNDLNPEVNPLATRPRRSFKPASTSLEPARTQSQCQENS